MPSIHIITLLGGALLLAILTLIVTRRRHGVRVRRLQAEATGLGLRCAAAEREAEDARRDRAHLLRRLERAEIAARRRPAERSPTAPVRFRQVLLALDSRLTEQEKAAHADGDHAALGSCRGKRDAVQTIVQILITNRLDADLAGAALDLYEDHGSAGRARIIENRARRLLDELKVPYED